MTIICFILFSLILRRKQWLLFWFTKIDITITHSIIKFLLKNDISSNYRIFYRFRNSGLDDERRNYPVILLVLSIVELVVAFPAVVYTCVPSGIVCCNGHQVENDN